MHLPKVSVIIPVYNVESYVEESLKSVTSQTFQDLEIIIINDGSTDGSLEILKKYEKKYGNIIIHNQENKGLSAARNKGIELSRGKYLYFMDSDDLISNNAIEQLYENTINEELDLLLFSGKSFIDDNYTGQKKLAKNYIRTHAYNTSSQGTDVFIELIKNKEYFSSACLYFVKKDTIIKNNLMFYEGIIHEDELFTFKLILLSENVGVSNKILFYRRVRNSSIMTDENYYKSYIGYYSVLLEMHQFIEQMNLTNLDLRKAVYKKLSDVLSYTIKRYISLDYEIKKNCKQEIKHLKKIASKYNKHIRFDNKLFIYSEKIYFLIYFLVKKIKR